MSVELHLPDLPEVPISLGSAPGAARVSRPWPLRVRDALSAYLPLLLMALLALATWWLVKNSPQAPALTTERPVSQDPDYTMTTFSMDRFDATGRLKARIEGDVLRHYPATDRIEIDDVQIRAFAADGRVTLASAARAIGNGDGSEVQLLGGAEVTRGATGGHRLGDRARRRRSGSGLVGVSWSRLGVWRPISCYCAAPGTGNPAAASTSTSTQSFPRPLVGGVNV